MRYSITSSAGVRMEGGCAGRFVEREHDPVRSRGGVETTRALAPLDKESRSRLGPARCLPIPPPKNS
jgi:hypothetical protein